MCKRPGLPPVLIMPGYALVAMDLTNLLSAEWWIVTFGLIGILVIIFAETGLLIGFFLPETRCWWWREWARQRRWPRRSGSTRRSR